MNLRALKYLSALAIPIIVIICLMMGGWWTWGGLLFSFGVLPALELVLPFSTKNMDKVEEAMAKKDKLYDFIVWLIVPVQYFLVFYTLYQLKIDQDDYAWYEYAGYISALGIACAVLGINVAHELGHRSSKFEQTLSKMLLLTSLYMHFFIEHNRGHHSNVSTPNDPATSRYGEMIYAFWFRSTITGYLSAWKLENTRLKKLGKSIFSIHNEMLRYQIIQLAFLAGIFFYFGAIPTLCFIISATIGFLLLESVNYVEHYGLQRKINEYGAYEKTLPIHSWNSNHPLGRLMLFELTRHSDHHYMASRPYQVLRHFDESPQLPTGYPGMVILSLIPPLWFKVMHKEIDKLKTRSNDLA
ncbi:MAG: alkane 1-monooxygenase [Chitinophagales bacterium]